jgi:hypothetical protein
MNYGPAPKSGRVVYRFDDGWTIQELTGIDEISMEGVNVRNCLAEPSTGARHADRVKSGELNIFSLRDPDGFPLISLLYDPRNREFSDSYGTYNTRLNVARRVLIPRTIGDVAAFKRLQAPGTRWHCDRYWGGSASDAKEYWMLLETQGRPRVAEFLQSMGASENDLVMAGVPLPTGLTHVSGGLDLVGYDHPLPAGLTGVGEWLNLTNYQYPLPDALASVGDNLVLGEYRHPLPPGLTSVGGYVFLGDYKHALPPGLRTMGYRDNRGYAFPLPGEGGSVKPNRRSSRRRGTSRRKRKTSKRARKTSKR